jgi:adenylate kinase
MDNGDLVPDQVTIDMLEAEVDQNPNAEGFIFDGFPRTEAQAGALDTFLETKNMKVNATIALEAEDDILVKRLLERGQTSGRTDDQDEEKIRNRFDEYNQKTAPLREYYQGQQKFHSINGIGTIEEITARLTSLIERLN